LVGQTYHTISACLIHFLGLSKLGVHIPASDGPSFTSGLIGAGAHQVLPNIQPIHTFILTGICMLPIMYHLWRVPSKSHFLPALIQCTLCSYMFGWHVHEKAILMVTVPLGLLAANSEKDAKQYLFMATVCHYSLFPLLFHSTETPIKILLLLSHSLVAYALLYQVLKKLTPNTFGKKKKISRKKQLLQFHPLEIAYLLGLVPLQLFVSIAQPIWFKNLEFLPLLATSVYCALGISHFWVVNWRQFLTYPTIPQR